MSSSEKVNVTLTNISGINMKLLNVYNMALCTDPFDGANKLYVDTVFSRTVSNIGIGAKFYQSTQNSTILIRSIPTSIFASAFDNTSVYLNSNMFYMPYPVNRIDTTTISAKFPSSTGQFDDSVLAFNGKIYCPPYSTTYVLIIDTNSNSIDTTSLPFNTEGNKYSSANLAPNGKIYCIPSYETRVLIIDPMFNTLDTTSISVTGESGTLKWLSSVTTPKGILYGMPFEDTRVLIINTNTNTFTTVGVDSNDFYASCALAPNGKIYSPPFNCSAILMIDTATNICDTTTIKITSATLYQSACLAPNGNIYCAPFEGAGVTLIINPLNNSINIVPMTAPSLFNYAASRAAPNGLIYTIPRDTCRILILNPNTNVIDSTSITIPFVSGNSGYTSGTLAPNGKMYYPPYTASNILILNTGVPTTNMRLNFDTSHNKGS